MIIHQQPTIGEFLKWPEQKPYLELIHGTVRQKAMPDSPHSFVQSEFARRIGNWSEHNGFTLTEQRCSLEVRGESHVVLPDVAWFSMDRLPVLPVGAVCVPPTLAVEVLSPGDRYGEVQEKVLVYLGSGVSIVWVVDPSARNVTIYRPLAAPELVAPPAMLGDPILTGLAIPLTDLFARLPVADTSQPKVQD